MKNILLIGLMLLSTHTYAQVVGEISMLRGTADIIRSDNSIRAKLQMPIKNNDSIKTDNNSKMQLTFKDNTVITLGANTQFLVEDYLYKQKRSKAKFKVKRGSFKVITGKIGKLAQKSFLLKTKTSLIGIRGTVFSGQTDHKGDLIACIKGRIEVSSLATGERQGVEHGEMLFINQDGAQGRVKKINQQAFTRLNYLQKTADNKPQDDDGDDHDEGSEQDYSLNQFNLDDDKDENDEHGIKPDMKALISNNAKVSYEGSLSGTVKGETLSSSTAGATTTREYKANIKADIDIDIDFGGNQPLKVEISEQKLNLTSAKLNGNALTGTDFQTFQQQINSGNNLHSTMNMQQTINPDALTITGTYTKDANGLTTNANLNGRFNNNKAEEINGTFVERTQGASGGVTLDRTINSNFHVKQD